MIRLLSFVEARTVTGPVKNLLDFARRIHSLAGCEPVDVELAAFMRGETENDFTRAVQAANVILHTIPEWGPYDPRVLSKIHAIVAAARPDIVQTHSIKSHALMRVSNVWRHRPWVAFHHGYTSTNVRMRVYNELDRWSLRKSSRVVTVSSAFEKQLLGRGVDAVRIVVVHNAVDPAWGNTARDPCLRAATRASLGIGQNEKAALIVGRLSNEKAHKNLIRAMAMLRVQVPHLVIRLIIVGDGPARADIERVADSPGLAGRVIFTGQVSDVRRYYAAADLAVLASMTEGSPNALLEAMAACVPVVSTAVGGIPEIVTHRDTALLVKAGDVGGLAEAIREALRDTDAARTMAERAHAVIIERHSPERRTRFLSRLYAEILQGK